MSAKTRLARGALSWLRDVIRGRGIRLPALERALDVNEVILAPSYDRSDALAGR